MVQRVPLDGVLPEASRLRSVFWQTPRYAAVPLTCRYSPNLAMLPPSRGCNAVSRDPACYLTKPTCGWEVSEAPPLPEHASRYEPVKRCRQGGNPRSAVSYGSAMRVLPKLQRYAGKRLAISGGDWMWKRRDVCRTRVQTSAEATPKKRRRAWPTQRGDRGKVIPADRAPCRACPWAMVAVSPLLRGCRLLRLIRAALP